MQGDVTVGMAGQPRDTGDLDAAEHQRGIGSERMRVLTDPRPRGRSGRGQVISHTGEIGGHGHLEVGRVDRHVDR